VQMLSGTSLHLGTENLMPSSRNEHVHNILI
jgi:hypothetical protein